jgi:hypothetical protein
LSCGGGKKKKTNKQTNKQTNPNAIKGNRIPKFDVFKAHLTICNLYKSQIETIKCTYFVSMRWVRCLGFATIALSWILRFIAI